ncbi:MAG TPA: PKD domain-containing protein [Frankiaceae bacterium]|jgi:PKD repeat protein|nr:PKD domain-containing protein [Frankiaceae bacterium]
MKVRSLVATAATAATMAGGMATLASPAGAATPTGPVSSIAATWTPSIATSGTDGTIETIRQVVPCGSLMYAVGSFTQIAQGGTTYTRNNVFSFNASTGAMTSWAPNINPGNVGTTGSGAVNSIALSSDCSTAYLGGVFNAVNGTKVSNIAAVSTTTGALITTFGHTAAGQVATVLRSGSHLLVGGYFSGVNGSTKPYMVSVSLTSGQDDGYVNLAISGNYNYKDQSNRTVGSNPTRVWNTTLSPDGTKLLVMGDFTSVAGQQRQQIFMLDLGAASATLDPWYSSEFNQFCDVSEPFYLQDASWSPDMSKIYTASTGYKPASGLGWKTSDPRAGLCDAAAAFPATPVGNNTHLWVNYTGCDSLFSTAADATTVYIGGHERFANNPNGCDAAGPGAISAPGASGLSSSTGLLSANPTRARGNGADDELVTAAGLWIASDNAENSSNCGQTVSGTPGLNHAGLCFLPYASAPIATYTSTCNGLTCFFDATASTAPGSAIASYSWNFGDGTSGTGVNPSHTYTVGQTYTVTLTVTDIASQAGTSSQTVSPAGTTAPALAFVGGASTNGNALTESVTVPAGVKTGNALLLVANGAAGSAMTAPAGWTQVDTVAPANATMTSTLWERVATATDAGTTVTVNFPTAYHGTVQLLAYSGTSTVNPIAAYAKKATAGSATSYVTPTATVPANGDLVVSLWSTKSSAVNAWTAPAGQSVRSTAYGSGTGRVNSLAADGGIATAGPAGGLTATTDLAGSSFAAWTIVLTP